MRLRHPLRNFYWTFVLCCFGMVLCGLLTPTSSLLGARGVVASGLLTTDFEENAGQTDPHVRFLARGPGYGLFLAPDEAVLALQGRPVEHGPAARPGPGSVLRLRFAGGNPNASLTGGTANSRAVNYLLGRDRSRWRTGVRTFAQVRYHEVYPGVDAVFYGQGQELEYDLIVAPGADPAQVRLRFDGATDLQINSAGELRIRMGGGEVVQRRPDVYQEVSGHRRRVPGRYRLLAAGEVGFELGTYDTRCPLIIDPVLMYTRYLGGSDADLGLSAYVDGDVMQIAGRTVSTDFPVYKSDGNPIPFRGGPPEGDAFIARRSLLSSGVGYCTYLGGSGRDAALAIQDYCVVGYTYSIDFPTTPNAAQVSGGGNSADAFVVKLSFGGSDIVYSTYLGGSGDDWATGVSGGVVVGQTRSPDFRTVPQGSTTLNGPSDAFVAGFNFQFRRLDFSRYLGGSGDDAGTAVAYYDGSGCWMTGDTWSSDFPGVGAEFPKFGGVSDGFVARIGTTSGGLGAAAYLGGSGADRTTSIVVGPGAEIYVGGETASSDFPAGGWQTGLRGVSDGFVTHVDYALYGHGTTYLGGTGADAVTSLALNAAGKLYVAGNTWSNDFPIVMPVAGDELQRDYAGGGDGFLGTLNASLSTLEYATYLGGAGEDRIYGIGVGKDDVVAFVGASLSQDFPVTPDQARQPASGGGWDAVIGVIHPNLLIAPEFVSVTALPDGKARLIWTDNSRAEQTYQIERMPIGGNWLTAGAVPADNTEFTDSGLTPKSKYLYRVRASNPHGLSGYTTQGLVTALPPLPPVPGSFQVTQFNAVSITVAWTSPKGNVDEFRIESQTGTDSFVLRKTVTGDVRSTVVPAEPNRTYRLRMFSANAAGVSGLTEERTVLTLPLAPEGLRVDAVAPSRVDLAWQVYHSGVDYVVERRLADGGVSFATLGSAAAGAYQDAAVTAETGYAYRVRARNAVGVSAPSEEVFAKTSGGKLKAPKSLQFGKIRVGRTKDVTFSVRNTSRTESLRVWISMPAAPFKRLSKAEYYLEPRDTERITLRFSPTSAATYRPSLILKTSDPQEPEHPITLIGASKE